MVNFDQDDLDQMQAEMSEELSNSGIECGSITLTESHSGCVEFRANLLRDGSLDSIPQHQQATVVLRGYLTSEEADRAVIWGSIRYSVSRDRSRFFPVPVEYGDEISIEFGWEFDAQTLQPSYADVRERASIHYVSVLPSAEVCSLVRYFSNILNRWIGSASGG